MDFLSRQLFGTASDSGGVTDQRSALLSANPTDLLARLVLVPLSATVSVRGKSRHDLCAQSPAVASDTLLAVEASRVASHYACS